MKIKDNIKLKIADYWLLMGTMTVLLLLMILISCCSGRYYVSPLDVIDIIFSRVRETASDVNPQAVGVVITLRLPRIITAVIIGSAMALSGAAYQGVFKNPLVAPDMLGVSSGACVGASIGILLNMGKIGIQGIAFLGGIIAVFVATTIPKIMKNNSMVMLVLSGIIVGGLLSSVMGLIKYLADPDTQLAEITHWQLGSLTKSTWDSIAYMIPPILCATIVLLLIRWRINILSLGEEEAKSLGTDVKRTRGVIIICATVLTASSVCVSGTIGWIGLVIPHFARMIVGPDNKKSIPLSIILGAIFLLLIDTIARIITSAELPLSILTGFVGAPFYFYLLLKQRMRMS